MRATCVRCGCGKRVPKRRICSACLYAQRVKSNPLNMAYMRLKGHAKERGKAFDLTLEDFTAFCVKCDYITKKGTGKLSYHIDRIDESGGYTRDNIQVLTNTENIKKYKVQTYPGFKTVTVKTVPDKSVPF